MNPFRSRVRRFHDFRDVDAFVTGAASGIGRAVAEQLGAEGGRPTSATTTPCVRSRSG
jgi:hypothetical protein